MIWVSKAIQEVEVTDPNKPVHEKNTIKVKVLSMVNGTYNKSKHGLIGSKAI